jgi:integration host factor subunit beta
VGRCINQCAQTARGIAPVADVRSRQGILKARSVFTFAVTYRRSLTKLRAAHRGNHVVRAQLIALLAAQHPELSTRESEIILNAFFEGITEHLVKGGRVEIRGFGSFSTRDRAAHTGRNPRSGELVEVDARRALHFTPGKELRKLVADSKT